MKKNWNKYVRQTTPGRPQSDWEPLALKAYEEGKARPFYPAAIIEEKLGITSQQMLALNRLGILPINEHGMIADCHVFAYYDPDEVWDGVIRFFPDVMPVRI